MIKKTIVVLIVTFHAIIMLCTGTYRYIVGTGSRDKNEFLVSVVIPVYNSIEYLSPCLDSLFNQTLSSKIEYIFVDDQSTDNSTAFIEYYIRSKNIKRTVRILHNEKNIGPGPSRNAGIEAARGKYVGFMDPDDWISPNFFESLYNAAVPSKKVHYDVSKGVMLKSFNGNLKYSKHNPINVLWRKRYVYEQFHWQHVTGLFRRKLLVEHPDARYGTANIGEDLMFLLTTGFYANNITFTRNAKYYYRIRNNSLTKEDRPEFYRNKLESVKERAYFCFRQAKYGDKVSNEFVLFTLKRLAKDRKTVVNLYNALHKDSYLKLFSDYNDLYQLMSSYLNGTLDYNKF